MANILVLDDEPDVKFLIKRILQRKGHEVSLFAEEEETVAFARLCSVDLAMLDVNLKKRSGVEVLEESKNINPMMHAMMRTAFPTLETAQKAVKLGDDLYCVKPIEVDELEQKVASLLGTSSKGAK